MPIYLLDTTRRCAAGWSRHVSFVPVVALEGRGLTDPLVELGARLGCRPVLILTSDQSVNWVSEHREDIEPLYRISLPADNIVRALAPRVIAQVWMEGPDTDITFTLFSCDRRGKLLGLFPGRKLVCSPPAIGNTAVCVPAPEVADELVAPTMQFIDRLGYRGLGSLEFKRDRRSGRSLIIEPTVGRTDC